LDDGREYRSFWFTVFLLLVFVYYTVRLFTDRKATEVPKLKSCLATATEQIESPREQLKGLEAQTSSLTGTTTTLRHNLDASCQREAESSKRVAEYERENRRLRQYRDENKDLAKDRDDARLILSQWETILVSLDKAGIDTRTRRGGWVVAIEELCEPKAQALSAVKEELADVSSALDKKRKECAKEKAANEAAQAELELLKIDAHLLKLDNQQMKSDAETIERRAIRYAENASRVSRE
jgi:cell shape-determining protein MreC